MKAMIQVVRRFSHHKDTKSTKESGFPSARRGRLLLCVLWAFVVIPFFPAHPAITAEGPERLTNPVLEARAVALQKELRCVVCQSQSLDESDAPLAADLRRLIRAHIEKGETNAEIESWLVARYGDFILMKPPVGPDTYALWFGPFIILLMGGAAAALVIMRAQKRAKARERY